MVQAVRHPAECIQRAAAGAAAHLAATHHKEQATLLPDTFTEIYVEALPVSCFFGACVVVILGVFNCIQHTARCRRASRSHASQEAGYIVA